MEAGNSLKNAQTSTNEICIIIHKTNCKPGPIECVDGKEFVLKVFADFSNSKDIKRCSRYTSKGTFHAESFNRIIPDLPIETVLKMQIGLMNCQKYFKEKQ